MVIRPITPEERIQFSKIQSISYLFPRDYSRYEKNPDEFKEGYEYVRAAFDDSGKMCSGLELYNFRAVFDGNIVQTGGIAGVATLPAERNKRYVRKLFEYIIEEMYERGDVFSYLYPFSYEFYRKFGYELNMTTIKCTVPFTALEHFRQSGRMELYLPGMDPTDIKSVYSLFIQGKNLALDAESHWNRFHKRDPYQSNTYLYIWYDNEGLAKGYLQYTIDRSDKNSSLPDMKLNEIIWLNGDAFRGMMAFLYGFAPLFRNLVFVIPNHIDILTYFPEQKEIHQQIQVNGSNRIVNAKKALKLMKAPEGQGALAIEVLDQFFPKNSGKYLIEWENGSIMISSGQNHKVSMSCGINHLSQLITGFSTVQRLYEAGHISISGDMDKLNCLFTEKDLFINDYF
ncbi:MAG TPA: GNAT family N-acetyltransferase [Clostridiales bacterium]|nr:GNAT family N-acetyltransferase [Clostridiales bacterium]